MKASEVVPILLLILLSFLVFVYKEERHKERLQRRDVWIVEAQKFKGHRMELEDGWEPFQYDRKANVIYLRKRQDHLTDQNIIKIVTEKIHAKGGK